MTVSNPHVFLLKIFLQPLVAVLTADDLITKYERRALARERTAAAQMRQLDTVAKKMKAALEELKSEENMPATDKCLASIRAASGGELKRAEGMVKNGLVAEIKEIKGAIARERAANVTRLEKMMLKEDLPESAYAVKARLRQEAL